MGSVDKALSKPFTSVSCEYLYDEEKNVHSAILVSHTNLHAAITATHIPFDNSHMHQES